MSTDCWNSASNLRELDWQLSTTMSSMADSVNMPGRRNGVPMRSFADTMRYGNPSLDRGVPIHEWWCRLLDSNKRNEHLNEILLPNDYGCNSTTRRWGVGWTPWVHWIISLSWCDRLWSHSSCPLILLTAAVRVRALQRLVGYFRGMEHSFAM